MTKVSQLEMQRFILRKLLDARYIGKHQAVEENILKNVPKDERKEAHKALKKLKTKGFLLWKKKHYGVHVSINQRMFKEIREFLI